MGKKKIDLARIINYALLTDEYQAAIEVAPHLKKVVPAIVHDAIDARLEELKKEHHRMLLVTFSAVTDIKTMDKLPIYPEPDFEQLHRPYISALGGAYLFDEAKVLSYLATFRKSSEIVYSLNAPIGRVLAFLKHPEFAAMIEDESLTTDKLAKIFDTLAYVYLTPANMFDRLKDIDYTVFDEDTIETLEILEDTYV